MLSISYLLDKYDKILIYNCDISIFEYLKNENIHKYGWMNSEDFSLQNATKDLIDYIMVSNINSFYIYLDKIEKYEDSPLHQYYKKNNIKYIINGCDSGEIDMKYLDIHKEDYKYIDYLVIQRMKKINNIKNENI
jgi:hypothetical protein